MKNGLCYVAGTGTSEGLIDQNTIAENMTITNLKRVSKAGILQLQVESRYAYDFIERLEISACDRDLVGTLNGGKQKKVSLAKWLFNSAKFLLWTCLPQVSISDQRLTFIISSMNWFYREPFGYYDFVRPGRTYRYVRQNSVMFNGGIRKVLIEKKPQVKVSSTMRQEVAAAFLIITNNLHNTIIKQKRAI